MPQLARVRESVRRGRSGGRSPFFVEEPLELAPAAMRCQLLAGGPQFGFASRTRSIKTALFEPLLRIVERERPLPPVDGHDPADPA